MSAEFWRHFGVNQGQRIVRRPRSEKRRVPVDDQFEAAERPIVGNVEL